MERLRWQEKEAGHREGNASSLGTVVRTEPIGRKDSA